MGLKSGELLVAGKRITVRRQFDVVSIEAHCGDDYEAVTLFDDVLSALKNGPGVVITCCRSVSGKKTG